VGANIITSSKTLSFGIYLCSIYMLLEYAKEHINWTDDDCKRIVWTESLKLTILSGIESNIADEDPKKCFRTSLVKKCSCFETFLPF